MFWTPANCGKKCAPWRRPGGWQDGPSWPSTVHRVGQMWANGGAIRAERAVGWPSFGAFQNREFEFNRSLLADREGGARGSAGLDFCTGFRMRLKNLRRSEERRVGKVRRSRSAP